MAENAYDGIAKYYHLLFDSWPEAVESEGKRLDCLFRPRGVRSVLDCTCGTGLQAIGLAKLGYAVNACDTSEGMLRRARQNARQAGVRVRWLLADIGCLQKAVDGCFDAAISCGNSLSHLSTEADLQQALASMYRATSPGGWCLVDAGDYETMLRERPAGLYYRIAEVRGRPAVFYDTRSYSGRTVTATFNLERQTGRGWKSEQFVMRLMAWHKDELHCSLVQAGYTDIEDTSTPGKVELLARRPGRLY